MATGVYEPTSELIKATIEARRHAYCPYSKFHVGASVVCDDGAIYTGVNVENASYGLTVCAERVAIMKALSDGHRKFKAIAVCCDIKDSFKASCGACRQFMAEFGVEWDLIMIKPDGTWARERIESLLPMAFTPASLKEERE